MGKQRNGMGKATSMPVGIGIGLGTGIAITLIGAVILAFALEAQRVSVEMMGYGIMVVLFISAFAASIVAMWCVKHRKMQVSLITAGAYLLSLFAINALFFGGQYEGVGATLLVVAIAGAVAGFVGSSGGKQAKHRRKIKLHG